MVGWLVYWSQFGGWSFWQLWILVGGHVEHWVHEQSSVGLVSLVVRLVDGEVWLVWWVGGLG